MFKSLARRCANPGRSVLKSDNDTCNSSEGEKVQCESLGDHRNKASIFFQLSTDRVESIVTSPGSSDHLVLAYFGDAFLNYQSVCYLQSSVFKSYQFNVKLLTLLRTLMVSNKTLEFLCQTHFSQDIDKKVIAHLNTHSKGTILEAIIELCRQENGENFASEKLVFLFDFMKPTLIHFIENNLKCLPSDDMTPAEVDLLQTNFVTRLETNFRVDSFQTVKRLNTFLPKERLEAAHWVLQVVGDKHFSHSGEVMTVDWRSRKGYHYTSSYYTCCGRPVDSNGVLYCTICPRSLWKNSRSFHPGKLTIFSNRRCGGGSGSRGINDHIPTCHEPTWSCCFSAASAEGCQVLQSAK